MLELNFESFEKFHISPEILIIAFSLVLLVTQTVGAYGMLADVGDDIQEAAQNIGNSISVAGIEARLSFITTFHTSITVMAICGLILGSIFFAIGYVPYVVSYIRKKNM